MEPYIGEIRVFSFPWAPRGWAVCDGSLLPYAQNAALGSLLSTAYGGDGTTTFGLPDLRGRAPLGTGVSSVSANVYQIGAKLGAETVQLTVPQLPTHAHGTNVISGAPGDTSVPTANLYAAVGQSGANARVFVYVTGVTPQIAISPSTVGDAGGGAAHNNMQPFSVANFCIATVGFYPSRP